MSSDSDGEDDGVEQRDAGRLGRVLWLCTTVVLILGSAFVLGVYNGYSKSLVSRKMVRLEAFVADTLTQLRQDGLNTPVHFLEPARNSGSGVTVNADPAADDLVLLTGFFGDTNGLRLITRNGEIKAKWDVAFYDYFAGQGRSGLPASDWNVDLHGSVVLPDGSVVFNFEYLGTVKLDRCGRVDWALPERTHHSIVRAEGGGFWIPGREINGTYAEGEFRPFSKVMAGRKLQEDVILHVSDDGRILESKSVPEILFANGLGALLTANGLLISAGFTLSDGGELVHLNKIDELSQSIAGMFPEFEAGDLLLSLRNHNLILVVDPADWHVKWYQVGPWQRQHDPRFAADGTIRVFNNNAFVFELDPDGRAIEGQMSDSNIMAIDPATRSTRVIYGDRPGERFSSVLRGMEEPLSDDRTLITEFEAGRAFEVDRDGKVVWEYINRYDDDQVAEITGAAAYPAAYFEVAYWSCPVR